MERQLISSGSPYEPVAGFSRAVRVGRHVFVAGTAPTSPDPPPRGAHAQAQRCLEIVVDALAEAGARPEHVVRTRLYLVRAGDFGEVARAHAEVFAEIRPATTAVVVAALLDPRWLIEVEAEALLPG